MNDYTSLQRIHEALQKTADISDKAYLLPFEVSIGINRYQLTYSSKRFQQGEVIKNAYKLENTREPHDQSITIACAYHDEDVYAHLLRELGSPWQFDGTVIIYNAENQV